MKRRVVITGVGAITPLGHEISTIWDRLIRGESGITPITSFDVQDLPSKIAGQVITGPEHFRPEDWVSPREQAKTDRFIILGIAAAHQALADARWLPQTEEAQERTGVYIGSGIGGLPEIERTAITLHTKGARRVSPFFIPSSLINLVAGQISIQFGLRGPNLAMVTACSSGAHAIGEAARIIQSGDADVMVAGGTESAICPIGVAGFSAMRALSTGFNAEPTRASRPWDKQRDGFIIGEGAGILVLEDLEHAQKRGAPIYGEVVGYGLSGDAYHIAAPHDTGEGAYRSMSMALKKAHLQPEDIGYINAHGTSTPMGDLAELRAVERLFSHNVAMSSTKSSIGHLLGAAGSVEAIFSLLTLKTGIMPPTLNLEDPEPTRINLVPLTAQENPGLRYVMSNSFGFGGKNATLIFGKVDDALLFQ